VSSHTPKLITYSVIVDIKRLWATSWNYPTIFPKTEENHEENITTPGHRAEIPKKPPAQIKLITLRADIVSTLLFIPLVQIYIPLTLFSNSPIYVLSVRGIMTPLITMHISVFYRLAGTASVPPRTSA